MERIIICSGCILVRGMLDSTATDEVRSSFEELATHPVAGLFTPHRQSQDPLERYPRIMNPHRHPEVAAGAAARRMLLHPLVMAQVASCMGEAPLAIQSMYYFKPPGARGQNFHQDNHYAQVEPGTCWSAWIPLDRSDRSNGCLRVVADTDGIGLLPEVDTDTTRFAYGNGVGEPLESIAIEMEPTDVLCFNGQVIHGSSPNGSQHFRRALICHYAPTSCTSLGAHFLPALDQDGREVQRLARQEGRLIA